jgi:hypothetical protein
LKGITPLGEAQEILVSLEIMKETLTVIILTDTLGKLGIMITNVAKEKKMSIMMN